MAHYNSPIYSQKLVFWRQGYDPHREPRPNLTVTGRRIDGPAGSLQTDGKGYGSWTNDDQFIMTRIDFPTLGYWEITAHYRSDELDESDALTFVVWVTDSLVSTAFDRRQYMNFEDGVRVGKALGVPDPEYPEKARRSRIQGTVVLAIAINQNGGIDKVKIVQRVDPDLDQAAVDVTRKWNRADLTASPLSLVVQCRHPLRLILISDGRRFHVQPAAEALISGMALTSNRTELAGL